MLAVRTYQALVLECRANREFRHTHERGHRAIRGALVEIRLGPRKPSALELTRSARTPAFAVQRGCTALSIALTVLVHSVAVTLEHTSDLAPCGETEFGAGEHRCCESHRARVCVAAGADWSGCIEEGESTLTVSDSEVLADHLDVVAEQRHAVLEFHESPPKHRLLYRPRPPDAARMLDSAYAHAARTPICHLSQDRKPCRNSPPMSGALNFRCWA